MIQYYHDMHLWSEITQVEQQICYLETMNYKVKQLGKLVYIKTSYHIMS